MTGTSRPNDISTRLRRIAELARYRPKMVLSTLAHHMDEAMLRQAFEQTRKQAAPGVDGETAESYGEHLEDNLLSLLNRFKTGSYKAPPVRRVFIPKSNGKLRPLGLPTIEDKVLQRAVAMVLSAVYEQDFLDGSYGFRPGRSAHQALGKLRDTLMEMHGGWVLEVDIEDFFGSVDHGQLRSILDKRVTDGVIRRSIDKWLKAGVLHGDVVIHPDTGTPQGGVISPLLANIYLHDVLDEWFEQVVKPRMTGKCELIRYCDDFIIVFSCEQDARRLWTVLAQRFAKYGLRLHPDKTRLFQFDRPERNARRGEETFDFLGFTHYWTKSKRGYSVIKQKTAADRFWRAVRAVGQWCRQNRHMPVYKQHEALGHKVRGHYGYYGIIGNSRDAGRFVHWVYFVWRKWLDRRSQHRHMSWERFGRLRLRYPLPTPPVRPLAGSHAANVTA